MADYRRLARYQAEPAVCHQCNNLCWGEGSTFWRQIRGPRDQRHQEASWSKLWVWENCILPLPNTRWCDPFLPKEKPQMIKVALYLIVFVCMSCSSPIGQDCRPRSQGISQFKKKTSWERGWEDCIISPNGRGPPTWLWQLNSLSISVEFNNTHPSIQVFKAKFMALYQVEKTNSNQAEKN